MSSLDKAKNGSAWVHMPFFSELVMSLYDYVLVLFLLFNVFITIWDHCMKPLMDGWWCDFVMVSLVNGLIWDELLCRRMYIFWFFIGLEIWLLGISQDYRGDSAQILVDLFKINSGINSLRHFICIILSASTS